MHGFLEFENSAKCYNLTHPPQPKPTNTLKNLKLENPLKNIKTQNPSIKTTIQNPLKIIKIQNPTIKISSKLNKRLWRLSFFISFFLFSRTDFIVVLLVFLHPFITYFTNLSDRTNQIIAHLIVDYVPEDIRFDDGPLQRFVLNHYFVPEPSTFKVIDSGLIAILSCLAFINLFFLTFLSFLIVDIYNIPRRFIRRAIRLLIPTFFMINTYFLRRLIVICSFSDVESDETFISPTPFSYIIRTPVEFPRRNHQKFLHENKQVIDHTLSLVNPVDIVLLKDSTSQDIIHFDMYDILALEGTVGAFYSQYPIYQIIYIHRAVYVCSRLFTIEEVLAFIYCPRSHIWHYDENCAFRLPYPCSTIPHMNFPRLLTKSRRPAPKPATDNEMRAIYLGTAPFLIQDKEISESIKSASTLSLSSLPAFSYTDIFNEIRQNRKGSVTSLASTAPVHQNFITLNNLAHAKSDLSSFREPSIRSNSSVIIGLETAAPEMKPPRKLKYFPSHTLPSVLFNKEDKPTEKSRSQQRREERELKKSKTHPQMQLFPSVPSVPVDVHCDEELIDAINTLSHSIGDGINITHNIDPEVKAALNKAFDALISSDSHIAKALSTVETNISAFNDYSSLLALTGTFFHHIHTRTNQSFVYLIFSVGNAYLRSNLFNTDNAKRFLMGIVRYANSYTETRTVPQIDSATLSDLCKLLSMILSSFLLSGKKDIDIVSFVMKLLMEFDKASKSVESSITFVVELINKVVNYLRVNLLELPSQRWIVSHREDIAEFQKDYDEIVNQIHEKSFPFVPTSCTRVHALWMKGSKLLSTLTREPNSQGLYASLQSALSYLLTIKKKLEGMNLGSSATHQEPFCMSIIGAPDAGKTMALSKFTAAVAPYLVLTDRQKEAYKNDPNALEYARAPGVEFWDGYKDEPIIKYDEFGQETDVAGVVQNQYFELIRIKNIFASLANMAALEDKGNVRIIPQFMVLSTNRRDFSNLESIVAPDAVTRRFDIAVVAVPKLEFSTEESLHNTLWERRFDPSKFPMGEFTTVKNEDMLDFHEYDYTAHADNRFTGKIFTFDQLVQATVQGIRTNELRYKQFCSEMSALKEKHTAIANGIDPELVKEFETTLEANPESFSIKKYIVAKYSSISFTVVTYAQSINYYLRLYGSAFIQFASRPFTAIQEFYHDITTLVVVYYERIMDKVDSYLTFSAPAAIQNPFAYIKNMFKAVEDFWKKTCIPCLCDDFFIIRLSGITSSVLAIFLVLRMIFDPIIKPVINWFRNLFSSIFTPFNSTSAEFQPSSSNRRGGRPKSSKKSSKPKKSYNDEEMRAIYAEGSFKHDTAGLEITNKIVRRNTYTLTCEGIDTGVVTFIAGRICLMPRHFITYLFEAVKEDPLLKTETVVLKKSLSSIEYHVQVKDLFNFHSTNSLQTLDAVLVELPINLPQHANISKYFITQKEVDSHHVINARLVYPRHNEVECQLVEATRKRDHTVYGSLNPDDTAIPDYVITDAWEYNAETRKGKCGSLLMAHEPTIPSRKILGIHAAGSDSLAYGIANILTYESISECLKQFSFVDQEFETTVPQAMMEFHNNKFTPLYQLDKPVHTNDSSKILKSPLYNSWRPSNKAPAQLRKEFMEGVCTYDPMYNARSKYLPMKTPFDLEIYLLIAGQFVDDLRKVSTPFNPRILTFEEAVNGIEGTTFGPIDSSSSPGFPYIHTPGWHGGKSFWLGPERDLNSERMKQIRKDSDELFERAVRGERSIILFVDSLKDELRKFEKVRDPRMFNVGPWHYLVVWRRLFGSGMMWISDNKIANGMVVGVNPYSIDWDFLAKRMSSKGPDCGAGDYKAYDASEDAPLIHMSCIVFNLLYNDEYSLARQVLFLEAENSRHIIHDLVYEWDGSVPSGHPATTHINNISNHLLFRYCWYALNGFKEEFIVNFSTYVYLAVQGDDNIFNVSPAFKEIFTESNIAKVMLTQGMNFTSDSKTAGNASLRRLEELTFLKRSFRYERFYDRYAAPLSLDTVLEIPYWTKDNSHALEIVHQNIETSMRELSLHSPDVFNRWAPLIIDAARKHNVPVPCTSRRLLLSEVAKIESYY